MIDQRGYVFGSAATIQLIQLRELRGHGNKINRTLIFEHRGYARINSPMAVEEKIVSRESAGLRPQGISEQYGS